MNTFKFVAFSDYISSLTKLRLVVAIRIDGKNSEIKCLIAKSPDRKARASLIARNTIDFRINIYKKCPTTYHCFCRNICSRRHAWNVRISCRAGHFCHTSLFYISDRKIKDCSTIHSWSFFKENIVVKFSRTNVVALCHKQLIRRHLHILAAFYTYVNRYKVIAPCHVTYTQQKQHCLPFWKRHITALSTRNAI